MKIMLTADIFAPAWFLTLYVSVLPFNLVLRILDIFLYEGYKIIYRIGLCILKIKEEQILKFKGMDQVMLLLKDFKEKEFEDEDIFITLAQKFMFTYSEIHVKIIKNMKNKGFFNKNGKLIEIRSTFRENQ